MKFDKNDFQNIVLLTTAIALVVSMFSMLIDNNSLEFMTPLVLLLAIVLVSATSVVYMGLVIRRVKPKRYIYFSYALADKDLADRVILTLNQQFRSLSKYRFEILTGDSIPFGESIINTIQGNLLKADIIVVLVSPSYLKSKWCREEFINFTQEGKRVIPIVTESFSNLSELPIDLTDIKALSLRDCSTEKEFTESISRLAKDLIRQRRD